MSGLAIIAILAAFMALFATILAVSFGTSLGNEVDRRRRLQRNLDATQDELTAAEMKGIELNRQLGEANRKLAAVREAAGGEK